MTQRPTRKEREALLAGDRAGALEPDEAEDLALLADVLADAGTWAEPRAGLEDAVVQAVAEAEPADGLGSVPAASAPRAAAAARRRRLVLAIVAVAAAVVVAFGVVAITRGHDRRDYRAQLQATGLAPGSRASADITRNDAGFRVTLDAHGLPALPPGEYYQAWLKNAANVLVPIGTFSSSDGRVTLWSGVSPSEYRTMTVTIEATDNVQDSSGRRVLTGDVRPG